jgi:hypothetical protein
MSEEITDEQIMEQLGRIADTAAVPEEKHNAHTFLNSVATSDDTTKVGFLKEEEVGIPKLSVRTLKELALYSKDIAGDDAWANYFDKRAEILTSTSLSKDAKLLELAIIQRREVSNVTPQPRQVNKGWFKKREPAAQM